MTKISAILFDYGGVICRTGYSPISQTVYDMDDIQSDPELAEEFKSIVRRMSRGKASESEIDDLLRSHGHPVPDNVVGRWRATINELFAPDPIMLQLIQELKDQGITAALLSNIWPLSEKIFRENNWYAPFDQITLSCLEGYAKPDPEIYDSALKKLAVPAANVLYIDDLEWNLAPALELGMHTLQAESPEQVASSVHTLLK